MSQDWLRDLYLRWSRLAGRRPHRTRITVQLLEDRVVPDAGLPFPILPDRPVPVTTPQFVPSPSLRVSPTEVVVSVRGSDPQAAFDALLARTGAPAADLARSVPLLIDGQTGMFEVGLTAGTAPADAIDWLKAQPEVEWASPNYYSTVDPRLYTPNDPLYGQQYHHQVMQDDKAWDTTAGDPGIIVAVTDDGVLTTHPDLAPNLWVNKGEIPNNGKDDDGNGYVDDINGISAFNGTNQVDPAAPDSHGTHVAGIIAARADNATGVAGVAGGKQGGPGVSIMGVRVFGSDDFNSVYGVSIAKAMIYAANNGAKIINSSFVTSNFVDSAGAVDPVVRTAFDYIYNKGVLHLIAAGNDSSANTTNNNYTHALIVASSDSADVKSDFSNWGKGVDIIAPGTNILSTVSKVAEGVDYEEFSGTSMATPAVAGVAALIWSAHPTWTRDQVVAQLLGTTDDIYSLNDPILKDMLGTGRANAYRGVTETLPSPRFGTITGLPAANGKVTALSSFDILTPYRFDPATVTSAAFELRGAGPDGTFGTTDDVLVPLTLNNNQPYRIGSNSFSFTFPALAPDHYRFTARASKLRDPFGQSLDGNGDGAGGDDFVRVFDAAPAVSGTVFEDWNADGQASANDYGVSGVTVYLDKNNNGKKDVGEAFTQTGTGGRFVFGSVPAGAYSVALVTPAGWTQTGTTVSYPVTVSAGSTAAGLNFGLGRTASVYGSLYKDLDQSGTRSAGEAGVAGFSVFLDTDGNGKYDPAAKSKVTTAANNGLVVIPDNGSAGSPITITSGSGRIVSVTAKVTASDTLNFFGSLVPILGNLTLTLVGPDGTRVPLLNDVGGFYDELQDTVFDANSPFSIRSGSGTFTGSYRPTGDLSVFNGLSPLGTWTLEGVDNQVNGYEQPGAATSEGLIDHWSITITTSDGDQLVATDQNGNFRFDVVPGNYGVGVVRQKGYRIIAPATYTYGATVVSAKLTAGTEIGLFPDNTAPAIQGFQPVAGAYSKTPVVDYKLQFTEPVEGLTPASFALTAAGSLTSPSVQSVTPVAGNPNAYIVRVQASIDPAAFGSVDLSLPAGAVVTDRALNPLTGLPRASIRVTVDTVPPTVALPGVVDQQVFTAATWPGTLTGTAADIGSGVAKVQVSVRQEATGLYWGGTGFTSPTEVLVDAVGTTNWSLPLPLAALGGVEGGYSVRVLSYDFAGNTPTAPVAVTIGYDAGAPTAAATPSGVARNDDPIPFVLTFSEPVYGFVPASELLVTGGTLGPVTQETPTRYLVRVVPAGDGPVTLDLPAGVAADFAGHATPGATASVVSDRTAPTLAVASPAADGAFVSAVWANGLTGSSGDALSGVARVEVAVRRASTGLYWTGGGFTAADPVYLPTAGTAGAWTFPFPVGNFPADDNYQFLVRATDAAGNITTSPVYAAIDNLAPAPAVGVPGVNALLNAAAFDQGGRISGTASDTVSGPAVTTVSILQVSTGKYWDGAGFTAPAPLFQPTTGAAAAWTYIALPSDRLADGQYVITARTVDRAGNVGTAAQTFRFDNTAPVPALDIPDGGTGYNPASWAAAGQLTGHVADTGDTVSTRVAVRRLSDGLYWNGSFFGSDVPVLHNTAGTAAHWQYAFASSYFPDEGRYEAIATSTDAAGNVGSTATQFSFDRTPPASAVTLPGGGAQFNLASWPGAVPGTASDNLSGVTRVRLSIRQVDGGRYWDGAGFTSATEVLFDAVPTGGASPSGPLGSWTYPFPVAGFNADGSYVVSSYATDGAGITQQFAATAVIQIDRTPPTGAAVPAGPTTTKEADIPFDFDFSEPVAGLPAGGLLLTNAQLIGVTQKSPSVFTVRVKPLADGTVSVGLADHGTTDLAGNPIGPVAAASVQSVTTPPRVTVTPPAAPPVAGGTAVFRVTFSQEVAGFDAAALSLSNASLAGLTPVSSGPAGSVFDVTVSPQGAGPVSVTVNPGTVFNRVGLSNGAAGTAATTAVEQRFAVGVGPVARLYNRTQGVNLQVNPFGPDYTGETRIATADFTGDGVPDLVAGTGPGFAPMVVIIDGATSQNLLQLTPFESTFTGGVYVAVGDITGDGAPDLVISPDQGGGPRVQVRDGKSFGVIADFFGIDDPNFRGGARTAIGDVSGDGRGDLIVAAGFGGGPRVAVFEGKSVLTGGLVRVVGDFFAYEPGLRNGVYVSAGDLDGDGFADVAIGGGPGGGPRVSVLNGHDLANGTIRKTADFFAGDTANRGGVRVAVDDLSVDPGATLLVGSGAGGGTRVTGYNGRSVVNGAPIQEIDFDLATGAATGVYVG